MFIYSFDDKTTTLLKSKGLKIIQETDKFVIFKSSKEAIEKYSDLEGIYISNKMKL